MDNTTAQILQELSDLSAALGGTVRKNGGNAPYTPLRKGIGQDHGEETLAGGLDNRMGAEAVRAGIEDKKESSKEIQPEEKKEDWSNLDKLAEALDAKITIGSEQQNEKARKWFEKNSIQISCTAERYDPFKYADDFNRLVKSSHPTMSQVASMMICLAPVRHTRAGERLFGHLENTMRKAERLASREKSTLKRQGVL